MFGPTPAELSTPRTPVSLTGTWFGRMGLRPYELLDATRPATQVTTPIPGRRESLPFRGLAA